MNREEQYFMERLVVGEYKFNYELLHNKNVIIELCRLNEISLSDDTENWIRDNILSIQWAMSFTGIKIDTINKTNKPPIKVLTALNNLYYKLRDKGGEFDTGIYFKSIER
jgi:hypothetical protein